MKKWEEIIRRKLEGYEKALPEDSFAEFLAIWEGKKSLSPKRNGHWLWGLASIALTGVAAVLLLRPATILEDMVQIVPQQADQVAMVVDSAIISELEQPVPPGLIISKLSVPKNSQQAELSCYNASLIQNRTEEEVTTSDTEEEKMSKSKRITEKPDSADARVIDNPEIQTPSPFIPHNNEVKPIDMRVGVAAGAVAGGGLLAALFSTSASPSFPSGSRVPGGNSSTIGKNGVSGHEAESSEDVLNGTPIHSFPLLIGLSSRMHVTDRLFVSVGIDYSSYKSIFKFSVSGDHIQRVQYIGTPIRLDWLIASGKRLDVYAGAGLHGDICTYATYDGAIIMKDPPSISVLGAGGVQLNLWKHVGIYIEPELSWRIPIVSTTLETYRTNSPLLFSFATGLRINLD